MKRHVIIVAALIVIVLAAYSYQPSQSAVLSELEVATFAGGCFWCMEAAFEAVDGVAEAISGFTGGTEVNPTYKDVSMGITGHLEAVQVYYDPELVSYDELLDVYWRNIDPTDDGGQFFDRGNHYTTAIFYHSETERELAEASRDALDASGRFDKPVVSEILEFTVFYEAEEYHQDYYKKKVLNYKLYSEASGRKEFIEEHWDE